MTRRIRKVWKLKRKHPRWGIRRISEEIGESKDKVYRILMRIKKGDVEVTEDGKVIDRTEPKGIVARQKAERALSQEETSKSKQTQVGGILRKLPQTLWKKG
jgi:ribosome biogenesis SPOUT family RNA methylase Rps3